LQIRRIPRQIPARIYREADERFLDSATHHEIAVKRVVFKGKPREMMVVYDRIGRLIELVTIHPLRPEQKQTRIASGRWKPL